MAIKNLRGLSDLAKAATGKKGKQVLTVPLEDVISKKQIRKRFRNLGELAASMKEEEQQTPIIVYPKDANGKYVIQKGERRWRALKIAEIPTIDIIINEKDLTVLDETAGELIENIQRDDLTSMEIAEALKRFVDEGWPHRDIANRIGKSVVYVSTHLSLLKVPECVKELYEKDLCNDTETLNNLRLLYERAPKACEDACQKAIENGGISRKESRALLNTAKGVPVPGANKDGAEKPGEPTAGADDKAAGGESGSDGNAGQEPYAGVLGAGDPAAALLEASPEHAEGDQSGEGEGAEAAPAGKPKTEPKNQDALPPIPADKDWKFAEPKSLIVVVNVPTDDDVKRGILMLDRVSKEPGHVWVKMLTGKKGTEEKIVRVFASDIELVGIEG